ncbi:MAG: tRNA pseudouridine38-40 synthase [Flavobacterium sp.]
MPKLSSFALGVSYCGADFHGWQYQNESLPTVQAELERALSEVAAEPIRVTCAGRTDSGVHATNQVVNFQTAAKRPLKAWVMGTNANLPDTISVNWSREVSDEFNARHSARARRYLYLINNNSVRSALFPKMLTREHRDLDVSSMHSAAQFLLGENDFTSFRAAHCQSKTAMRNIHHLNVRKVGDLIVIDVQANAFLLHMVRNIAGVLMDIGAGKKEIEWMSELLSLKDRSCGSVTGSPKGLYLVEVTYPDHKQIPAGPSLPHLLSVLG